MRALLSRLERIASEPPKALFAGFDGFVDEIVHVVDRRIDASHYARIPTISEYGQRILRAAGLSANLEFVTVRQKLGGNGPIFADALRRLGAKVTYVGAVAGNHPVFRSFAEHAELIGLCEPAYTEALEFLDGKLICSKLDSFRALTWERIAEVIGAPRFAALLDAADGIAFSNWTMIASMNDLWEHILAEVLPAMTADPREKTLFFDLADPEKRERKELAHAVSLISRFHAAGFRTVFSLNFKEAKQIAALYALECETLSDLTERLGKELALDALVVHQHKAVACYAGGAYTQVEVPYCERPKLTTGAGDHFNSGFVFGYMYGMEPRECLLCGVATSGCYVRSAESPSLEALQNFFRQWIAGLL